MPEAEFHLHNEAGIRFPPLRPAYSDGDLFFGRFRALIARTTGHSIIGEGGTGRIHLVRDELMDREVALKIPLDSILRDPAARADVIQETRQAMELTHPNIVRIHDFHESDRLWGISMQQVRGKNLDEWRYENTATAGARRTIRPYPVEAIRDWIAQLCDALRYAHEDARMVHRDIKPKNLMLERRDGGEKLLLTDFGITQRLRMHNMMLSRDQGKAEETKGNMGTLPYMPWEQIAGGQPSPRDDIYAVGATIYELVTGRPPFYEGSFEQIKIQIKETAPPSMEERLAQFGIHAEAIPQEWEDAIAACLAKRPEDRPQSMRELISALGFQSTAAPHVEALVLSQQNRILQLESRIEALGDMPSADPKWESQALGLQEELDLLRETLAVSSQKTAEAEGRIADLAGQLDRARQDLTAVRQDEGARLGALREQSAIEIASLQAALATAGETAAADNTARIQELEDALHNSREDAGAELQARISELEARLDSAREDAASKSEAETAALRDHADLLQEKLRQAEHSREQTVAAIREEAEKRLQSQAVELHKARTAIEKTAAENEELNRLVATEKNRQAASLRPLLIVLLCALFIGLGGGFAYSELNSGDPWEVVNPKLANLNDVSPKPVTYAQFSEFAKAKGFTDPSELLVEGAKPGPEGEVCGVTGHLALQYCDWLTQLARTERKIKPREAFTLPDLTDIQDRVPLEKRTSGRTEWTIGTAADTDPAATGKLMVFRHDGGKLGDPVPVPPVFADRKSTFRLKLVLPL